MKTYDGVLASGLLLSPAWVPHLNAINEVLTFISLVLGGALALFRLWSGYVLRQQNWPDEEDDDDLG